MSEEDVIEKILEKRRKSKNTVVVRGSFRRLARDPETGVYSCVDVKTGKELLWEVFEFFDPPGPGDKEKVLECFESYRRAESKRLMKLFDFWFSKDEDGKEIFNIISEFLPSGSLKLYIKNVGVPSKNLKRKWTIQILEMFQVLKGLPQEGLRIPTISQIFIKKGSVKYRFFSFMELSTHLEIKVKPPHEKATRAPGSKVFSKSLKRIMYIKFGPSVGIINPYSFAFLVLKILTGEKPFSGNAVEARSEEEFYENIKRGALPKELDYLKDGVTKDILVSIFSARSEDELINFEVLGRMLNAEWRKSKGKIENPPTEEDGSTVIVTSVEEIDKDMEIIAEIEATSQNLGTEKVLIARTEKKSSGRDPKW